MIGRLSLVETQITRLQTRASLASNKGNPPLWNMGVQTSDRPQQPGQTRTSFPPAGPAPLSKSGAAFNAGRRFSVLCIPLAAVTPVISVVQLPCFIPSPRTPLPFPALFICIHLRHLLRPRFQRPPTLARLRDPGDLFNSTALCDSWSPNPAALSPSFHLCTWAKTRDTLDSMPA